MRTTDWKLNGRDEYGMALNRKRENKKQALPHGVRQAAYQLRLKGWEPEDALAEALRKAGQYRGSADCFSEALDCARPAMRLLFDLEREPLSVAKLVA